MALMLGAGYGWVPPILNQLKDSKEERSLTAVECSWIASLHYFTRGTGPIVTAILVDRIGRNPFLVIIAGLSFMMWVVLLFIKSVIGHYIARLVYGLAFAFFEGVAPMYIGETCSARTRGSFGSTISAAFYAGELIAFTLATYVSYEDVSLIHAILGLVTVMSTILLKEPVQYLIMKGNLEKAEKNFHWLRDSSMDTKLEFEEIKQNVLEEKSKDSFAEFFRTSTVFKSVRIVVITLSLTMCTGFPAVSSFITMVFAESSNLSSNEFTILYGLFQMIASGVSWFLMDKFNRRTLMLICCASFSIIHAIIAALFYIQKTVNILYFDWCLFFFLSAYSCLFAMLMFPLSVTIRSEMLPQSMKAVAPCFYVGSSSITGFGIAKIFLPIAQMYGVEMNFIIFSFNSLIMFVYIYFDLPETRGKSLVAIQKELKKMKK